MKNLFVQFYPSQIIVKYVGTDQTTGQ